MRYATYQLSLRKRKLVEQVLGWLKAIAGLRKSRFFGCAHTELSGIDGDERLQPDPNGPTAGVADLRCGIDTC